MADIEKISISGTSYDVRDANTLRNLNSTQAAQIVIDGTYNGAEVTSGEVFTSDDGAFMEFNKTLEPGDTAFSATGTSPVSSGASYIVKGSNGKYLAYKGSSSTACYVSDDGTNWTPGGNFNNNSHYLAVYGNGTWVVPYAGSAILEYSTNNGTSWTALTSGVPAAKNYKSCFFWGNKFFIIPSSGKYWTSSDGISWTQAGADVPDIHCITFDNEKAVALVYENSRFYVYTSTDLESWTQAGSINDAGCYDITYADGTFYVVASTKVYKSSDLSNWSTVGSSYSGVNGGTILSVGSTVFANLQSTTKKLSVDGSSLTNVTGPTSYPDTVFVLNNAYCYAIDGVLYTLNPQGHYVYSLTNLTPDPLPSQTGNSGKFLTTDGTTASWGNALTNGATGSDSLTLLGSTNAYRDSINIGHYSNVTANTTIAIGFYPSAKATNSIAIGNYAKIESNGSYGIAIGDHSKVQNGSYATALGSYAEAWGNYAIQIGYGINDTANTLKIGLSNSSSNNYTLLESDGTIPNARLKSDVPHKVSYTNPALTAVSGICTWTVTHTLGTTDFVATVFDTTTGKEVMFEGIHTDSTTYTINLTSSSDIASGAYKVVMIG